MATGTIVLMNVIADTNVFFAAALKEPERKGLIKLTDGYKLSAPNILPYEIGKVGHF